MRLVLEPDRHQFELAPPLHVHFFVRIDENIGDCRIFQQRLKRAKSCEFVEDFLDKDLKLCRIERNAIQFDVFGNESHQFDGAASSRGIRSSEARLRSSMSLR